MGTITQARGRLRSQIADRLHLTVECIRRHYLINRGDDAASPLAATLNCYTDFFDLLGDFARFTEFFLLQDMLNGDGSLVVGTID